jgi:hypothetical protein
VHREERTKHSNEVLFRLGHSHGLSESAERNIEELLNNLIADDSFSGVCGPANKLRGFR